MSLIGVSANEVFTEPQFSLKSSLHKFCGRHHDFVYTYEITVPQMTMDIFRLVFIHGWHTIHEYTTHVMVQQNNVILQEHLVSSLDFVEALSCPFGCISR